MPAARLKLDDAFSAVSAGGGYHAHLAELRSFRVSGIYAIIDKQTGEVEYVGESHSNRLYDTITRHFRKWRVNPKDHPGEGRRRGGVTFDRRDVKISYLIMRAGDVVAAQYREIQRLRPRTNTVAGCSATGGCDVPF